MTARRATAVAKPGTRAVVRQIVPGLLEPCVHCGERIGFRARHRDHWVIANVYRAGRWDRVEHFHFDCYLGAGSPHGEADTSKARPKFVSEETADVS